MTKRDWVFKRNCSLTPRQLAKAYAVLSLGSLSVATYFSIKGAWYIFGFSILELLAVGLAFLHYARHATDHEHIALTGNCLLVELVQAERAQQYELDVRCARIDLPTSHRDLIGVEARGVRVEIGRFLTEQKRRAFAYELRHELQSALASGG
jgi:uncharacterized membrane protein